jgi:DNA-binding SARP family transcriptional activator
MTAYRIQLFHRFEIRLGEAPVAIETRKVQELLCYLLLFRRQTHSREVLAGRLWGETSTAQSRNNLRKTLWQLQTLLRTTEEGTTGLLVADDDWVQLNPDAALWSDVALLETAYRQMEGIRGRALSDAQAELARQAIGHYRGDLLEDWYHDWCLVERQHYRFMALALLDKLCGYFESRGEYDAAIGYAMRILHHEPARESAHRRLMRLHALAGDRTAALRQYGWCVATLREELDVDPDVQTVQLYAKLQSGQFLQPTAATVESRDDTQDLTMFLQRLEQMQGAVSVIQQQLAGEAQSLRALLASRTHTP